MINSNRLQSAYIDLYVQLRKYIWDLDVVKLLATLETETYKSFPDVDKVRSYLDNLKNAIIETYREDEELQSAFSAFYDTLDEGSSDGLYGNLKGFREVN